MRLYEGCQNSPSLRYLSESFLKLLEFFKMSKLNSIYVNWEQKSDVNPRAKYSRYVPDIKGQ